MPTRSTARTGKLARRMKKFWRGSVKVWRRARRWWRPAPRPAKFIMAALVVLVLWLALNWIYQVLRKPIRAVLSRERTLNKSARRNLGRVCADLQEIRDAMIMTPDFLAAIAQVEGSGNPVARTYWRWSWSSQPFEVYRPASSAVGMYQITDGNFAEARRFCIHDHVVVADGPWNDWHSCWFNSLYARVIPERRGRADLGVPGSKRRAHSRAPPDELRIAVAKADAGRADPSVRRRGGR